MLSQKILLAGLSLGLIVIAGTAVNFQMSSPGLTRVLKMPASAVQNKTVLSAPNPENMGGDMGMGAASSTPSAPSITGMSMLAMGGENVNPAIAEQVGVTMMALQANPQDINVISDLTLLFYQAGDFEAMDSFLVRAKAINPDFSKVKLLTYLSENKLQDPILAAQKLEESIATEKNSENLALLAYLYAYILKDDAKAQGYLQQANEISGLNLAF